MAELSVVKKLHKRLLIEMAPIRLATFSSNMNTATEHAIYNVHVWLVVFYLRLLTSRLPTY